MLLRRTRKETGQSPLIANDSEQIGICKLQTATNQVSELKKLQEQLPTSLNLKQLEVIEDRLS